MVPGTASACKVPRPSVRPLSSRYRSSGGTILILAENRSCAAKSTGRCFTLVLAGSFPRKLSSFQFIEGQTGRGTNPPPQFGQTFPRTCSTQATQKVHSYEQILASSESGGSALLAVFAGRSKFKHGGLVVKLSNGAINGS
jgi:hypothetical protein